MRELITEITLRHPKQKVWDALANFKEYSSWNSFLEVLSGEAKEASLLEVKITPPGQKTLRAKVRLINIQQGSSIVWLGHFHSIPYLIDGLHFFEILPIDENSCRLIHREEFRGLLIPFVWGAFLNRHLKAGFEKFNQDLERKLQN